MLTANRGCRLVVACLGLWGGLALGAMAQSVGLTEEMDEARISIDGNEIVIGRNQDQTATLTGYFTKTSRACPPFCITPMQPGKGIVALGELEVIEFLKDKAATGKGVLIDTRFPDFFAKGTIPGAVNVPFATLQADNPFRNEILIALGAKPLGGDSFDFTEALDLALFCNGAWSDQSLRALRSLRGAGYPAEKLFYYRGGMQDWQILGLNMSQTDTTAITGDQP